MLQMDENSMIGGMLMGAGLREISQVLGLSKSKKSQGMSQNGEQPPAQQMAQGNMGDIDKILLLSKLQSSGLPGGPGGMPGPGGPMPGPGGPLPMPGQTPPAPSPPLGPPPGGMAAPLPQPGAPLPPGAMPPGGPPMGGGAPNPMMGALAGAAPGGPPQGGLPMQLLAQLLGTQGLV